MSDTSNNNIFDYFDSPTSEGMLNEDIINFAYLYDDKKKSLTDLENEIVDKLANSENMFQMKTFYLNHLDLFVNNQSKFKNVMNYHLFLEEYLPYRVAYTNIKTFLEGVSLHSELTSPSTPRPVTSSSPMSVDSNDSRDSTSSKKSMLSDIFKKKYVKNSIFRLVEPTDFAESCHKFYMYYYFMSEMREYLYWSKSDTGRVSGYARDFSYMCNNFSMKLRQEAELYCDAGEIDVFLKICMKLIDQFLLLNNTILCKLCINMMTAFELCKNEKIVKYFESKNIDVSKRFITYGLKSSFEYLVEPGKLFLTFLSSRSDDKKISMKRFSYIQQKIVNTKEQILNSQIISSKANFADIMVFKYLTPKNLQHFENECIKTKCKQTGGFDKKTAKYPRKWSKEYCKKTPCNKMGFSQKSSCRYYKNCYN